MKASPAQLASMKKYRDSHGDERAAYSATHREEKRAYRRANREEIAAYMASYYEAHKEEAAAYREDHKEEIHNSQGAYRATHKEEIRAYNAAYKAAHQKEDRQKHAEFTHRLQIIRIVNGCEDCGTREGRLEHHHVDPSTKMRDVSRMYNHSLDALEEELEKCVVLCLSCHKKRHYAMKQTVEANRLATEAVKEDADSELVGNPKEEAA